MKNLPKYQLLVCILFFLNACSFAQSKSPPEEVFVKSNLVVILKKVTEMRTEDVLDFNSVIALLGLPYRENVGRRGRNGIAHFFDLSDPGKPVASGIYWFRDLPDSNRARFYLHLWIDRDLLCLSRSDVEAVFGNIWRAGRSHNAFFLEPDLRLQTADDKHYDLMTYQISNDRTIGFSFYEKEPDCIRNIDFQEGKDK